VIERFAKSQRPNYSWTVGSRWTCGKYQRILVESDSEGDEGEGHKIDEAEVMKRADPWSH
jgi:hypothetical protein